MELSPKKKVVEVDELSEETAVKTDAAEKIDVESEEASAETIEKTNVASEDGAVEPTEKNINTLENSDKNEEIDTKPNFNKKKSRRKSGKKRLKVIAIIIIIAIVVGCYFGYNKFYKKKDAIVNEVTAIATIGDVSSVIEGSGTLQALQQYEITSLKKGEVIEDYFEEGDVVNKGDILYRMDDEEGRDVVDNSLDNISNQQTNVDKSYTSLENAADAIDSAQDTIDDANEKLQDAREELTKLNVKSTATGVVSNLYISKGDNVNANTKIADVYDNSKMILEIQFLSEYVAYMTANASTASVTLSKDGTELLGTVTKISTGSVVNSIGASVTNVEITVPNPGAVEKGDYATAQVGEYACSSEGTFRYSGESSITCEVAGKVEEVNIMVGDNVSSSQIVARLSSQSLTDNVKNASKAVDEANRNLTSKQRSYDEANQNISTAQKNLDNAKEDYSDAVESLDDYLVKAPISGTIIQKNIKAGEKLEASAASSSMAIIADLSSIVFEMSVDELDVSKLQVGMDVEVEADAFSNSIFKAKVTNISIVGTTSNGVTSYPVKVTISPKEEQEGAAYENYDKLIPGLNVSASVVIERVEDVVVVPVSAVRRGNIVIVSEDSPSQGISSDAGLRQMPDLGRESFSKRGEGAMPSDGAKRPGEMPPNKENSNLPDNKGGNMPPALSPQKSGEPQSAENSEKRNDRMKAMMDSLEIPKGYKAVIVETGLSDETFIEIKSGLSQGDKVLLPDTTASRTGNGMPGGMFGGMSGGMSGRMPGGMGGGMPGGMGGGMPGGNRGGAGGGMR